MKMLLVLTTVSDFPDAEDLAKKIIEAKLAACVQVLPQIISFYVWQGSLEKDSEFLLLIKTLDENYQDLEKIILANHKYEIPEIVAIPADRVSASYLNWMAGQL